jgi:hypothetical protein
VEGSDEGKLLIPLDDILEINAGFANERTKEAAV